MNDRPQVIRARQLRDSLRLIQTYCTACHETRWQRATNPIPCPCRTKERAE